MKHLSEQDFNRLYKPVIGPVDDLPSEVDVCIVGAGPVGLTLANLLGHRGLRVLLIEQNATTSDQPKAIAVNCEYRRVLDWLGLTASFSEHLSDAVGIRFLSPFGFTLAEVPRMVTPNGFPAMSTMSQPMFERILLDGAIGQETVSILYATPLLKFTELTDHVSITIGGADGTTRTTRALYIIGCDGAHSIVRKQLGIPFEGVKHDEQHLVLDLAAYPDQSPFLKVACDPRRPWISIPAPYGGRRLEFMLKRGENAAEFVQPSNIKHLVETYTGYRFSDIQIVRALVYTFSERIAACFRGGRAFLVGDSAHLMPPFGGQGLNTGICDALNLSWKLDAVIRGVLPDSILDSYEPERRDHVKDTISFAHWMGSATNCTSWPLAILRDVGLALAKVVGPARRYIEQMRYVPHPFYSKGLFIHDRKSGRGSFVGRLFPRIVATDVAGRQRTFDDLAGAGFSLVGIDVPPELLRDAAAHPLWVGLAPKLVCLLRGDDLTTTHGVETARPAEGMDTAILSGHSGQILLLRPDRHVAFATSPDSIAARSDGFSKLLHGGKGNEASAQPVVSMMAHTATVIQG